MIHAIFFDEIGSTPLPIHKNETIHYKQELGNLFLDEVHVILPYEEIKEYIEAYKYRSEREKGEILSQYYQTSPLLKNLKKEEGIVIVPAPMHWLKYFIRGYDHMYLLGKNVEKATDIPCIQLLQAPFRFRQSKLSRTKRREKKFGNFQIKSNIPIPKIVVLIDDVISTGSTANAIAETLKDAGVEKVYGLFLASSSLK